MENAMTPKPATKSGPLTPVPLKDVESELSRRLKLTQEVGESPVLRARMSNLIVFCDRQDLADQVAGELPDIVAIHPARVLLLLAEPSSELGELATSVAVLGHVVDPGRWVCSELISLSATGRTVDRLPYAVRSLLIGDLPVNLWWATSQPLALAGPLLFDLTEHVQQVIYDSSGWTDPPRNLAGTISWLTKFEARAGRMTWRVASDLNWRRLKYWRRLLSQALDPASAPGAIESLTEIQIEHGPHAVIQGWSLASWLISRLKWRVQRGHIHGSEELSWNFQTPQGQRAVRIRRLEQGSPEIHRLRLACNVGGKPGALNLALQDDRRLAVTPEGVMTAEPRTLTVPGQSRAELIGRQLSDRERDPVFRESMAVALRLAQQLLN
jgi:glucose-6-phosphate dehydrogenase assembly protein OpcA